MAEWRPIDTAPRDGTRFLATDGLDHDFAAWHRDHVCGEGLGHCGFVAWMPLTMPGEQWQPIETAPKDAVLLLYGTIVGAPEDEFGLYPKGPIRACGYWEQIDEAWALTDTTWAGPFINPTHWMPLPEPPYAP